VSAAGLAESRQADPLANPWGFYLVPQAGEEALHWFPTEAALVGFVRTGLWRAVAGVEPEAAWARELEELLEGPSPLRWDRLDRLNLLLDPLCQIHWWGSLQQLYEGEDPFAKDLREAWRDGVGRGPQDFSALPAADVRAFADFLRDVFNAEQGNP
jgi:hypothetical protein